MLEYEGPLQRADLTRTLWLVMVGPLLGLLWQVLVARVRLSRTSGAAQRRQLAWAGWAGVAGICGATVALIAHFVLLARLPAGERALYDHVASGARVAGLEAPLDLWMDDRAAVACGLACVVACAAAVHLVTGASFERTWPRWAWLQLALLGALLAFLADGLLTVVAGWTLAGAAGVWLAGWSDARPAISAASWNVTAVFALLLGAALLFWGFAGGWDDERYAREGQAAFVVARVAGRDGEATLTMTAPPGALVTLDAARAPSLRVPFVREPLALGSHLVRVDTGDTRDDDDPSRVAVAAGDDVVLVPVGPTLSLHAMRDALSLRDRHGEAPFRRALEARTAPGGVAVVAAALLAWLVAAAATSGARVPLRAPGALSALACGATSSMLAPMLLARADFLFPSAMHTGVVIASVGAALVLSATWRALGYFGVQRALVFVSAASSGLVLVALGLGGTRPALIAMGIVGPVAAVLHLVTARRPATRFVETVDADTVEDALLVRIPERLGELLVTMDRWVLGAVADAVGATARLAAWVVAGADQHLLHSPADRAADGLSRAAHGVEPWVGASLTRIAWGLLALAVTATLLHALWSGG